MSFLELDYLDDISPWMGMKTHWLPHPVMDILLSGMPDFLLELSQLEPRADKHAGGRTESLALQRRPASVRDTDKSQIYTFDWETYWCEYQSCFADQDDICCHIYTWSVIRMGSLLGKFRAVNDDGAVTDTMSVDKSTDTTNVGQYQRDHLWDIQGFRFKNRWTMSHLRKQMGAVCHCIHLHCWFPGKLILQGWWVLCVIPLVKT